MGVIRVDPEKLDEAAEKISRIAEEMVRVLEDLHFTASSAPSYDGDFGPRVQRFSLEGLAQGKAIAMRLVEDARYLRCKAKEFRDADLESQAALMAFGRQLQRSARYHTCPSDDQRCGASLPSYATVEAN